jgi:hypothetical protein
MPALISLELARDATPIRISSSRRSPVPSEAG